MATMAKTEVYASLVAYLTYATLSWQLAAPKSVHCAALLEGSLLILVLLEYTANLQQSAKGPIHHGWELRRFCSAGLYCVPLLPYAVLVTVLSDPQGLQDSYRQWQMACAVTLLLSSTCTLLLMSLGVHRWYVLLGSAPMVAAVVIVTMNTGLSLPVDGHGFCLLCVVCTVATTLQLLLPRLVPLAFSIGEAAICSHAATYFLFTSVAVALHKNELLMTDSEYLSSLPLHIGFLQVVVMSCALVITILYLVPRTRCSVGFYAVLFTVISCISTPILWLLLKQNFVFWLLNFVTSSTQKAYMFVYWATCSVLVSGLVWFHNHRLCQQISQSSNMDNHSDKTGNHLQNCAPRSERDSQSCAPSSKRDSQNCALCSTEDTSSCAPNHSKDTQSCAQSTERDTQSSIPSSERVTLSSAPSSQMVEAPSSLSIVDRKHFHIVAILTFLPGIALDCQMANMAGTCAIVVFAMLECQRLLSVWPYGEVLGRSLQLFVDSRDEGPVIVTHIYLLAGCVLPLWITNTCSTLHPALFSGLLSLGIGDTAAAVVGSKLGTHPWPGSKKTLEGTTAAIVSQFLALYLLHCTGYITMTWWTGLLAVTLTSLLEAFTSQIDNLILPLYMYTVLVNS